MRIIMLGPPGSGKGTQSRELAKLLGVPVFDVGYFLRNKNISELSKVMKLGNLLSDEFIISLVKDKIFSMDSGFILDGFPRTIMQAKFLVENDIAINYVIKLEISDMEVIRRLSLRMYCAKCGEVSSDFDLVKCPRCNEFFIKRNDDSIKIIKNRLALYRKQEHALTEFYADKILFIDACSMRDYITKKILLRCKLNA